MFICFLDAPSNRRADRNGYVRKSVVSGLVLAADIFRPLSQPRLAESAKTEFWRYYTFLKIVVSIPCVTTFNSTEFCGKVPNHRG